MHTSRFHAHEQIIQFNPIAYFPDRQTTYLHIFDTISKNVMKFFVSLYCLPPQISNQATVKRDICWFLNEMQIFGTAAARIHLPVYAFNRVLLHYVHTIFTPLP